MLPQFYVKYRHLICLLEDTMQTRYRMWCGWMLLLPRGTNHCQQERHFTCH